MKYIRDFCRIIFADFRRDEDEHFTTEQLNKIENSFLRHIQKRAHTHISLSYR